MNNKKAIVMFGLFIIFFVIIYFMANQIPVSRTMDEEATYTVSLYFLNPISNKLEPEERVLPKESFSSETLLVETVLSELQIGPKTKNLVKTIPQNVLIKSGKLISDENLCEIQLSGEYASISTIEELFCRASLVWTLTNLDFINNVLIYVDGHELEKLNNQPIGLLNRSNIVLNADIPLNNDIQLITLYFADENYQRLVPESRQIEVNPNLPMEEYIIKQLIAGPKAKGHMPTIPPDTKIREVKTDEGVCYVDLSIEFTTKQFGNSSDDLAIYSIVNSLAELGNKISKVQILVDSAKVNTIGNIDISKPIEPDKSFISE